MKLKKLLAGVLTGALVLTLVNTNVGVAAETVTVTNANWWDAWTPTYEIADGATLEFDVDLTVAGEAVYQSLNAAFVNVPTDGELEPNATNYDGYAEYVVLRSDAYGWGTYYETTTYTGTDYLYTGDSTDYATLMTGATYDILISRDGTTITYDYVITQTDGTELNCGYQIVIAGLADDESAYVFFTGDAGVTFTITEVEDEAVEDTESAEDTETTEGTEAIETTEDTETIASTEITEDTETTQSTEATEDTGDSEQTESNSVTVTNAAWWDAWTPTYEIADGTTLEFDVDLTVAGAGVYQSLNAAFVNVATDGVLTPNAENFEGYAEYVVLRSDAYGWGTYYETTTYTGTDYLYTGDSTDYATLMTGATYDILISRDGATITYDYVITQTDGTELNCGYQIVIAGLADDESAYVFFTGDAGVTFTITEVVADDTEDDSEEETETTSEEETETTTEEESETTTEEATETTTEEDDATALADLTCEGWWTVFTDGLAIEEDQKLVITGVTTNNGTENWDNMIYVLFSGDGTVSSDDYMEYFVGRADNYGWDNSGGNTMDGLALDGLTFTSLSAPPDDDYDAWAEWLAGTQAGEEFTITVTYEDGVISIETVCGDVDYIVTYEVADTSSAYYIALGGEDCTLTDLSYTVTSLATEDTSEDEDTESDSEGASTPDIEADLIISGFLSDSTGELTLEGDFTVTYTFDTIGNLDGANNYFTNFIVRVMDDDYNDMFFRADNWSWIYENDSEMTYYCDNTASDGTSIDWYTHTDYEGDWSEWLAAMTEGCNCTVTLTRSGNLFTAVMECGGTTFTISAEPDFFGDTVTVLLTGEQCAISNLVIAYSDSTDTDTEAETTEAEGTEDTEAETTEAEATESDVDTEEDSESDVDTEEDTETEAEAEENSAAEDTEEETTEEAGSTLTTSSSDGTAYYAITIDSADSDSYLIVEVSDESGAYIYADSNGTCYYVSADGEITEITDYDGDLLSLSSGEVYTVTVDYDGTDVVISFYNEDGEVVLAYTVSDVEMEDEITTTLSASEDAVITVDEAEIVTETEEDTDSEESTDTESADTEDTGSGSSSNVISTGDSSSTATGSTSPKTGDASPIIPIAVAILGCAAVVFASKKRMA